VPALADLLTQSYEYSVLGAGSPATYHVVVHGVLCLCTATRPKTESRSNQVILQGVMDRSAARSNLELIINRIQVRVNCTRTEAELCGYLSVS